MKIKAKAPSCRQRLSAAAYALRKADGCAVPCSLLPPQAALHRLRPPFAPANVYSCGSQKFRRRLERGKEPLASRGSHFGITPHPSLPCGKATVLLRFPKISAACALKFLTAAPSLARCFVHWTRFASLAPEGKAFRRADKQAEMWKTFIGAQCDAHAFFYLEQKSFPQFMAGDFSLIISFLS